MPDTIRDGTGEGYLAKVTQYNQLVTVAEVHQLIFRQSFIFGEAYTLAQVQSQVVTASSEEILCHITNTSDTTVLCISHVHICAYEGHGFGRITVASSYAAGGTIYTPGNHNRTSGNTAEATVYTSDGALTVTGGAQVCTKALSPETPTLEMSFNGSIILGLNNTMDVRFLEQAGATPLVGLCVEGYFLIQEN